MSSFQLQKYLSGSKFLIILTFSSKQSFKVNSTFTFCDHIFNSQTIYKFTTLFGLKGALSCFRQLPLNSNLILELFIHTNFGERHLFDVKREVNFSFDNLLDSHSEIMSGRLENVVMVL